MQSIKDYLGNTEGIKFTQSVTISKEEYAELLKYKDMYLSKKCKDCKCGS